MAKKEMKHYKYLDDLNVPVEEQYMNWMQTVLPCGRSKAWKEQREIYGFDDRETWNWNSDYMDYVYLHLKRYNEVNIVDLEFHHVKHNGVEYSIQEAIDKILYWYEHTFYPNKELKYEDFYKENNEESYKTFAEAVTKWNDELEDMLILFARIIGFLWW